MNIYKQWRKQWNRQWMQWKHLILLLCIITLAYLAYNNRRSLEYFTNTDEIPTLPRPFVNLYNDKDEKINVIGVSHPFTRETGTNGSYEQYEEWKRKGIHFIGITSYCEFPNIVSNPYDSLSNKDDNAWKKYDYMKLFEAWLYCFRDPDTYITTGPKALISESDFISETIQPDNTVEKKYDFIYVCLKDNDRCENGWQSYNRNWELAKKCLIIMCEKYHLKGLLVGRTHCEIPDKCHHHMTITDFIPQNKFVTTLQTCRFAFFPNILDASPRTMAEALCTDLPCLVNSNILGGWKYINQYTGEFFTDERDFEHSLSKLLSRMNTYTPSTYFRNNYGKQHTGVMLRDFICDTIPNLNFNKDSTKYIYI